MSQAFFYLMGGFVALCAVLENVNFSDGEDELFIVEKQVYLNQPRAKVFQYLGDLNTYQQWFPGILTFRETDTAPMSTGKHLQELHYFPILGEVTYDSVVTGYESPKYISWLTQSWFEVRTELNVDRTDDKTKPTCVTMRQYSRKRSYFFHYIVFPIMQHFYSQKARHAMINLRFMMQHH